MILNSMSYASIDAIVFSVAKNIIRQSSHLTKNISIRYLTSTANSPLTTPNSIKGILKTVQEDRSQQKIFYPLLLRHLTINTSAALGITQTLNTGLLISSTVHLVALGDAIRRSLQEYRLLLEYATTQKNLKKLREMAEDNLIFTQNTLKNTEKM